MEIRRLILSVKRHSRQWSRSFLTEVPALEVGNQGAIGHTCGVSPHRKNYYIAFARRSDVTPLSRCSVTRTESRSPRNIKTRSPGPVGRTSILRISHLSRALPRELSQERSRSGSCQRSQQSLDSPSTLLARSICRPFRARRSGRTVPG